jgi:hypothetical protein
MMEENMMEGTFRGSYVQYTVQSISETPKPAYTDIAYGAPMAITMLNSDIEILSNTTGILNKANPTNWEYCVYKCSRSALDCGAAALDIPCESTSTEYGWVPIEDVIGLISGDMSLVYYPWQVHFVGKSFGVQVQAPPSTEEQDDSGANSALFRMVAKNRFVRQLDVIYRMSAS